MGPQGSEDPGRHQAHQPEEPRAEGARRGLPEGAGGRQVIRFPRVLLSWTLAMIFAGVMPAHAAGPAPAPVAAPAPVSGPLPPPDPRLLDEMEKDVQHFAQMVAAYRGR